MNEALIHKLKTAGLLSEENEDSIFVSTGSKAVNKVLSGNYNGGVPIGRIVEFYGESSTAKTVFVTHILANAQKLGFYAVLIDSENTLNAAFARVLGLDPEKLIYAAPETLERCFKMMEDVIREIRAEDKKTPIVIGYDSVAVSPIEKEFESDTYVNNEILGALRAKGT